VEPVTVLHRYRAVLRGSGLGPALVASLIGRLALGMTGLAILLLVRGIGGSYTAAGAVAGAYAVAFAVGSPLRARSADRRGPRGVLLQCAVTHPAAVVALALLAGHVPAALLVVPAGLAGLTMPPLGSVMRALWGHFLHDGELVSAYSLESVVVELCFVVGPALTAVLAATAGPRFALLCAAAVAGIGGVLLGLSPVLAQVRPDPDAVHSLVGPLTAPAVRALLLTVLWVGLSFGAVEVAMPAFAEEHGGRPSSAGILLAIWSLGSMVGGLVYGGLHLDRPHIRQLPLLMAALAAGSLLPLLAPGRLTMAVALFMFGMTIAPTFACNSVLLGRAAPRGTATETFAWNGSMIFAGSAIGTTLAGGLADGFGPSAALAVAAGGGIVTLVVSLSGLRYVQEQRA
jgi:MFS family permease